ncbi:MAG: acetyl-CoA acetyltransferase [Gammaproteobacteria bacterium]|nr:acetyl-CoA acetyltransferase [Gammaproteobacteria bacterium]
MQNDRTPVLVGCGQIIDRSEDGHGPPPVKLMAAAARAAVEDAGSNRLLNSIDQLAAVGLTVDAAQVSTPLSGAYKNVPKSVANLLGIDPENLYYSETGGNTPQMLVNHFAKEIAHGRADSVLLTGGEALRTMTRRFNHWTALLKPRGEWRDRPGGRPIPLGDTRPGATRLESAYQLDLPSNTYPLFENALCAHYQRTPAEHLQSIGEMFHKFTRVAARNPYAWFPRERSAEELITPTINNRMVAYPYTKLLNSIITVNQAASVVMTSVANARSLGISRDKWVYLRGCSDAHDIWNITERINYHSSPALRCAGREALAMAGKSINDMDFLDIYSCFPSAVQIACDELGIAHDDPRGLTLTGGMPYFGGPGNNYSMHAIAEMMTRLREHPGKFGLLNANGWFLTKHSLGIYSTAQPDAEWSSNPPEQYQAEILQDRGPPFVETPEGKARVETFTVLFNRHNLAQTGIVIGRLLSGQRFIARTMNGPEVLDDLMQNDAVGRMGTVTSGKRKNIFVPE